MTTPRNRTKFRSAAASLAGAVLLGAGILAAAPADARPNYFEQFKTLYGIGEGDNLDACGVCHLRWTGTGARNLFGTTVEQQLYLGKSIVQSLTDVEGMDPDGDGYTSGAEIMTYMTLPGYNCTNFVQAVGAPIGYDTYITPLVATCLEPLDIRVFPSSVASFTDVGDIGIMEVTIANNGSTDPLEISGLDLLAGAPPSLAINAPTPTFNIPVGSSQVVQLVFTPTSPTIVNTHLRITSNDPDEGIIDVPVGLFSFPDVTAPGDQRAPCFATITKAMARYTKAHLKAWSSCYLEELQGRACDTGARDYKLGRAAAKFAAVIGGDKDKTCEAADLTALTLGFPGTCAAGCEDIEIDSLADVPLCLECMQERVMEGVLRDGAGTAPPDLPPNILADRDSVKCQSRILKDMSKAMKKMFRELTDCENAAVLAEESGGACQATLAAELGELRAKLDATVDKCRSTTDLLGCRFEGMSPDPACLGLSVEDLAVELTNTCFALYEEP